MQNNHFLKSFLFGIIFLSSISSGFSAETDSGIITEPDTITTSAATSITDKAEYTEVIIGNKSYHTFSSPNLPETTVSTEYVDGKPVGNTITKSRGESGEIVVEVKDKDGKIFIARSSPDGTFTGDAAAVSIAQDIEKTLGKANPTTDSQSTPYVMIVSLFLVILVFVFVIKAVVQAKKNKNNSDNE